jgi:acetyltransferase-like isoleucine patch superfamily enzyme
MSHLNITPAYLTRSQRLKARVRMLVSRILMLVNRYGHIEMATVFPQHNAHLITYSADIQLHDTYFNVWDEIVLDRGVILGPQVMFVTGRHAMTPEGVSVSAESAGPIHVHEGAFIGARTIILGGVTIGRGSTVGAGSVVVTDVPDREFWAGNPAKFVKRLA